MFLLTFCSLHSTSTTTTITVIVQLTWPTATTTTTTTTWGAKGREGVSGSCLFLNLLFLAPLAVFYRTCCCLSAAASIERHSKSRTKRAQSCQKGPKLIEKALGRERESCVVERGAELCLLLMMCTRWRLCFLLSPCTRMHMHAHSHTHSWELQDAGMCTVWAPMYTMGTAILVNSSRKRCGQ